MINIKKKQVLCVAVAAVLILSGCSAKKNVKSSSQSDYPTLPPVQFEEREASVDSLVGYSTLIVDATVQNVLPDERRTEIPESGSFEENVDKKLGKSSDEYTVRPIELKINETLKGNAPSDTITMYIPPLNLDCAPKFKAGDRLIFMLHEYPGGGYAAISAQQAYFYVAQDDKVYPAVVNDKLKSESGKSLSTFKKEIHQFAEADKK